MVRVTNGIVTDQERSEIDSARNTKRFNSKLECFSITNGIRPGEFSVIVGPSGNGKSSLTKTVLYEACVSNVNTYCLLSEEKSSVYKSIVSGVFDKATEKNTDKFKANMYYDSMLDWTAQEKNIGFFKRHIENQINELKIDMFVFDNFSTSFLSDLTISQQGDMISYLREIAATYDIAIVGVFHTVKGTNIYNNLIDGESVRGNSTSTNAGSYNYILTTFFKADPPRAILFVDKARYHKLANKTYWELKYNDDLEIYTAARKINHDDVNIIKAEVEESTRKKARAAMKSNIGNCGAIKW